MPDLPTVSEAFEADIGPFIAAIHDARDAMLEAAAAAKTLQETIDALHGKTLDINLESTGAAGAAGMAAMATEAQHLATDAQEASRQVIVLQKASQDSGAAAVAAGVGFRAFGFGLRLTGTALHWIVAGAAEFLAVAVPAAIALGAGLAVAAQGAQNVQQHFQALYAATESTYSAFHQTVGSVLGLGSALQNAQNAANPGVYEVLGSVVNDAKNRFADFAGMGLQVVHMFDEFSARITVDLQSGLGTQLHNLLSGAVTDLQQFGNILGNLGHALLDFASAMPGLAHVLLAIAVGLSEVIMWASRGGVFLTMAMGLEEMFRWGGLALGILVRLTGAMGLMNSMGATNFVTRFGAAILALSGRLAQGLTALGSWISGLGNAEGALGRIGSGFQTAGAGLAGFAESLSPGMVAAAVAAAAAIGFLAYKIITAQSATQKWVSTSSEMVAKANDLSVLPAIYTQLSDTATRLASSIQQTGAAFRNQSTMIKAAGDSWRTQNDTYHQAIGNNDALAQHMMSLLATANTVRGNINLLAGVFHTSAIGALALANAAGVNLQVGLTKGSEAAKIAAQQITNLKTGLGAMAAPAGVIGADMEAVGVQSQLAASKVGTVNQALDAFIGATTGGMDSVMQFNAALHAMGKDTVSTTQSLSGQISSISSTAAKMGYSLAGIGPKAQQSWQQFDAALQQGNTIMDTFRTGMAEGIVSQQQYQKELNAVGGSLLPYAAHSKTALAMVSQLSQEMGGPAIHSLKGLETAFGITGKKAQEMATGGMERLVARMSNLSVIARNLSATISSQLDSAMAGAIVQASGLDNAYKKWATDVMNKAPASTLAGDLKVINTAAANVNSTQAKAIKILNDNGTAAKNYATDLKAAATGTSDLGTAAKVAHPSMLELGMRAKEAAVNAQGLGTQAHTAATSAQGLTSNAQQATTQVKNLGSAAGVTQGHLGDVNNEIRTASTLAGNSAGPLSAMISNIGRVGAAAQQAAGQVHALATAISGLQSKSITVTTNMVTVASTIHRQHGGPVWPGQSFTVGEAGPETFVPSQPGYIIPNHSAFFGNPGHGGSSMAPAMGGGSGGALHATVPVNVYLDGQQVWNSVRTETLRWNVRNGNPQSGAMGRATAPGA